jgi:sporulation protein YlmC with PRC-barrel domain
MTAAAVAQTPPASSAGGATATQAPAGAGQVMTQMPPDLMRGSKLMGVDVYGSDNEKIGDVDEVLLDREGKIRGIIVGVGGFLGIGQKDVAIPYDQVQWMSADQAQTASNTQSGSATNTAGGVTAPANPGGTTGGTTASTANQPATTGSTGGTAGTSSARSNDNTPARAMVRMTKADLQNAPEFRYSMNEGGSNAGGASGTNPPAANRPAAPQ